MILTGLRELFECIQNSDHRIKTSYGVSKPVYGKTDPPSQGVGQGVAFGPTLWALISSKMIEQMKRKEHGVDMMSSLLLSLISIVCFAFVDDTDTVSSARSRTTTGEQMLPEFHETLNRWAGLLTVTGGEVSPEKSCWALIDFSWNGSDWEYRKEEDMPGECTLNDKYKNPHHLKWISTSEACETLRAYIAMDGNQTKHKESLEERSEEFGEKMIRSNCDPNTAIYTYNSSFIKSLEYSMVISDFTKKEWNQIVWKAKQRTLQKS